MTNPGTFFDAAARTELQQLTEHVAQRLRLLALDRARAGNLPWPNANFVGREPELANLRAALLDTPESSSVGIHGVGGMGKTALAQAFAYQEADSFPGGCWLLRCEGRDRLLSVFRTLVTDLEIVLTDEEKLDDAKAVRRVFDVLRQRSPALFLLDNVDHPVMLAQEQVTLLADQSWARVLYTTRLAPDEFTNVGANIHPLDLDRLPKDRAVDLIRRYQPGQAFASPEHEAAAREIVRELSGLTLAVETAAVYLGQCDPRTAEPQYAVDVRDYINKLRDDLKTGGSDGVMSQLREVTATLRPTLARLDAPARTVLQIASLLPSENVALPWVRVIAGQSYRELATEADTRKSDPWTQLIRGLIGMRLFQPTIEPRVVAMHSIIQRVLGSELLKADDDKEQMLRKLINQAKERCQFLRDDGWVNTMNRWELEPLIACSTLWLDRDVSDGAYISHEVATVFQKLGEESTAERLYEAARTKVKVSGHLSDFDPNYAALLSNQAGMLEAQGEMARAMEMREQVLTIYRLNFGNEHQFVATACVNLAKSRELVGRLEEAEALVLEAVTIDERLYGADHPEVATDLIVYAALLQQRGELDTAENTMQRIIGIYRKNLPSNHPHIAIVLSNLATLKLDQHKPEEAVPLLREAVTINRNCLGSEHPDLATRLNNLAMALRASGKLSEALEPAQEALTILVAHSIKTGRSHPNIQAAVNTLGGIALESGLPDPIVRHVINGILSPLQKHQQERPSHDEDFHRTQTEGAKPVHASHSEPTTENRDAGREQMNLAITFETQGRHDEAVVWLRKAAENGVPQAQFNLGVFLADGIGYKQDQEEAVKWYREAANQGYVNAIYNLAFMHEHGYGCQRNLKLAFELYQRAAKEKEPDSQYKVATLLLDENLQRQVGLDYRHQSQGALMRSANRVKILLKTTFGKLNTTPSNDDASQPSSWAFVTSDNQTAKILLHDAASRGHAHSLRLLRDLGWS